MIPGLTEGRIVHFVPPEANGFVYPHRHIPAIVVKVWDNFSGCSNLRLFLDGSNDHAQWQDREWVTSVCYESSGTKPYSWHFPEKVD